MLQYLEHLEKAIDDLGATSLSDFIAKSALRDANIDEFAPLLRYSALTDSGLNLDLDACRGLADALQSESIDRPAEEVVRAWSEDLGFDAGRAETLVQLTGKVLARLNLRHYADSVRTDWRYRKQSFRTDRSKTPRELHYFDCIEAPCLDECPVDQKVPQYMNAVRDGDFLEAVRLTREDNPLPSILGRVCDHLCENTCIRTHFDQPLAIRHMKRFIMDREEQPVLFTRKPGTGDRVAIIGAGPAGLAAAQELAYSGFSVTIFEAHPYAGGMVGGAIPEYRLPQSVIDQDMAILESLGVEIRYGQKAGADFTLAGLRTDGYQAIFVAVGAQLAKRLGLPGEDAEGILDALLYLRSVRENDPVPIGERVGIIGAGDTAMDCARSALRTGAGKVSIIYRRTIDQMPADREEIHACLEEGIEIVELAKPASLHIEDGALAGLVCTRTHYTGERDSSGRKIPFDVEDSQFEIPLDTMILAISQHSVLDFFDEEPPELTSKGYLMVDPITYETSIPGVYGGGDVAADGPSSIVKAAADGKAVAAAITASLNGSSEPTGPPAVDLQEMMVKRSRREYRMPLSHTPLSKRDGFEETVVGFTPEEAMAEAARCLDCHLICSLCVGVCPNMALMTYEVDPMRVDLPALVAGDGALIEGDTSPYRADQQFQIAVLTDFCNECGNCTTACPTSGRPYVDKPRLYLYRTDFEAETANAFMIFEDGAVESRVDGETHRLRLNGAVEYTAPDFSARLEPGTLRLLEAEMGVGVSDGDTFSLEPAADMYVLLRGLSDSMAHLPVVTEGAATKLGHPGYQD
jgi:putative selenate reductase